MNTMIPCAWILMTNRSYADYLVVFEALKQHALNKNMPLTPEKVTIDFELAAIKAYRQSFQGFYIFYIYF
jgi:hypothetical protein